MRRLLIFVIVVALAYAGYWVAGSRTVENGARDALADLQDQGWEVSYDALRTRGFPSRFDTTVTELTLTPPGGPTYAAPFLQAFALSYQPNKVIAAFPPAQTLTLGDTQVTLASTGMRASAAVRASTALDFDNATLVAEAWSLASDVAGVRMGDTLFALRAGADRTLDAYGKVDRITLPDDLWQQMFPHGGLPLSIDRIEVDAVLTLDKPMNRISLTGQTPPRVMAVELKNTQLGWGELSVRLTGTVTADAAGFAEGTVQLEASNFGKLARGLARIGAIQPGLADMIGNLEEQMAQGLPITLSGGQMRAGFIPLGAAPRLH